MTGAIAERVHNIQPDQGQGKVTLRIVPFVGTSHEQPEYRLLDSETLGVVKITEISTSGSVPELKIDNKLDTLVFLMDGQELVGAKQNRILNTDILVPAQTTLKIPVSCVEAGRWSYTGDDFKPGKAANYRVRSGKQERLYQSLRQTGLYDAGQHEVWDEVAESLACAGCLSPTAALHDAYQARQKEFVDFRGSLRLPENSVGLAVFHGSTFQGLDLFDRHSTLQYFWESLVDSYAIDWLMNPEDKPYTGDSSEVESLINSLKQVAEGQWESFPSPGEGCDYRLADEKLTGSALVWEDKVVVHMQLFPKQSGIDRDDVIRRRPRIHRPFIQEVDGS